MPNYAERPKPKEAVNRRLAYIVFVFAGLGACTMRETRADSTRLAQTRADSIRALGPAGWTDEEVMTYVGVVSWALLDDSALVARRSRSAAVRAFGRTVATQHRQLVKLIDSFSRETGAVPPSTSSEILRAHEREMRRLKDATAFDLAYVKQVKATLTEAQDQLRRASVADRNAGAVLLLNRAHAAIGRELRTAGELQRALEASGARTPPATKATKQ